MLEALLHQIEETGRLAEHLAPEIFGGFLGYLAHEWKHVIFRSVKRALRSVGSH